MKPWNSFCLVELLVLSSFLLNGCHGIPNRKVQATSGDLVSRRTSTTQNIQLKRGTYLGSDVTPDKLYEAYRLIQKDYQEVANVKDGWKVLAATNDGVEIAMMKRASDPTCPYIRISGTLPSTVEQSWNFMKMSNWDKTMPKINPFYDGVEIKGMYQAGPVHMTLARKRTKRIFGFGRRDFGLVSVCDVPREDGVWVSGSFTVETPHLPRHRGYIRAFQDSISYYKPIVVNGKEKTHLTIICRTDLNDSGEDGAGGWIPMWLYLKTIGRSGSRAIQGLCQLIQSEME